MSYFQLQRVIGAASPWLGLLLMFYFMGLAKVAEPFFLFRLPDVLRTVRPWERDGTVYPLLAVSAFGEFLRETPLRYLNTAVYLGKKHADLQAIVRLVHAAEAAHFWAGILFTPYIVYVWADGYRWEAAFFLFIQVLFNVYPIMHLRSTRGRLERVIHRSRPVSQVSQGSGL